MRDVDLFQKALGLVEPWGVVEVSFDVEQRSWICGSTFRRDRCSAARSAVARG
jgi:hypothetical protein